MNFGFVGLESCSKPGGEIAKGNKTRRETAQRRGAAKRATPTTCAHMEPTAGVGSLTGEGLAAALGQALSAAPATVIEATIHWVRTLVDGLWLSQCVEGSEFCAETQELVLRLKGVVVGEIATRSRVPIVWRLGSDEQPELRLQMRVRGGAVELHIAGLNCEPPSGAEALYEMASEAWAEAGVVPATALESISGMNRLSDVMWGLWKRRKDELAGTKVWKIVESLLGSAAVRAAAPMHDLCGLIIGTSFVARYRITCLRFSVLIGCRNKVRDTAVSAPRLAEGSASSVSDPPSPSGVPAGGNGLQVTCSTEIDAADEAGFAKESLKSALGLKLIRCMFTREPHKVHSGDRFSPSSMHWARLMGKVDETGWGGADPFRFSKLVQAGAHPGGACYFDRSLKGAFGWQSEDMTYKLTGKNEGRVIWALKQQRGEIFAEPLGMHRRSRSAGDVPPAPKPENNVTKRRRWGSQGGEPKEVAHLQQPSQPQPQPQQRQPAKHQPPPSKQQAHPLPPLPQQPDPEQPEQPEQPQPPQSPQPPKPPESPASPVSPVSLVSPGLPEGPQDQEIEPPRSPVLRSPPRSPSAALRARLASCSPRWRSHARRAAKAVQ